MKDQTKIKCPNCGTLIDVQDILAHQLEEEIKKKYQDQLTEQKKKYDSEFIQLNTAKREFEEQKRKENERFNELLDRKIKEERKKH